MVSSIKFSCNLMNKTDVYDLSRDYETNNSWKNF